jgi:SAM-dependent methyltransferase
MVDLAELEQRGLFAQRPEPVPDGAKFYHTVDLPGHGHVTGDWDLRAGVDVYLGRVDYAGCTVLEIGPSTGFVTFAMEQRGATVVAVDLPVGAPADAFPLAGAGGANPLARTAARRNAFWLAHQAFNSRARLIEANVDDLDPAVTGFDVAIVCNVMLHRNNPIDMLLNVAHRARTLVVTEADWLGRVNDDKPVMQLLTDSLRGGAPHSWFAVSPKLVEDVLALQGFEIVARDLHHQPFAPLPARQAQIVPHYTITARKTA